MAWYYKDGDREVGPVNKAELQQLIKARKIDGQTKVREENATQWQLLADLVKGNKGPSTASPRPPGDTPSMETAPPPPQAPQSPDVPPPPDGEAGLSPAEAMPPATAQQIPFQFSGTGGEYFKIWIVNIVLSVLTLGIYSAWAKVRRKQYFYGNTSVNNASFQYLANPVNILKGRAIVFIVFVAYSLVNSLYPLMSGLFMLALLPALPWFVVRALSFNARNSAMRNIRFNFHGTYWDAAKAFIFWPLLLPFTLGAIAPFVYYRQKKYIVDNSAYGTARFNFEATAKDYYSLVFKLLIPLVICILAAAGAGYLWPPAAGLVIMVFYLYAMAYFVVKSSNLLYNASKLSGHGFKSTMAIKEYAIIVVTNTLATVLTLGFFHPFAQVRSYRYKISQLALMSAGNLDRFVAAEQEQVSALGDEMSDFMDIDLGL